MNRRIDWIDNARLETKHGTALKVPWHVMHERDVQCAKEEEVDREREPTQSVSSHKHTHIHRTIKTNNNKWPGRHEITRWFIRATKKTYLSKHNLISKYFVNDWNFFGRCRFMDETCTYVRTYGVICVLVRLWMPMLLFACGIVIIRYVFFLKVKHGGMSDEAIEIDDSHSTAAILHTIKIRLNQQQQQPQQKRTKEEKKKKKKRRKSHRVFLVCH